MANVLGHGRISMIHFDAHADTGDIEFGSLWGHGQPMRRLIESGALRGDRFLQVGLRGYWPPPETLDWMAGQRMRSYEMTEIVHRGLDECLTEAFVIAMDDCDGVFLSVDIDVCDPGHAPGTGTPEPGGLSARELLDAVRRICLELPVVGIDVVEVAPAVRPRRHHRGTGQPGRARGAVGHRAQAPGRARRHHLGSRPATAGRSGHACMTSTRPPSRWCAACWRTPRTGCGWTRCRSTRARCPPTELYERLDGVIRDSRARTPTRCSASTPR